MVSSKKVAHRLIFFTFFRVESLEADLAAKMQEIKRCVSVRVCACVRACTCSCECESSDESAHAHIKRAGSRARVRAGERKGARMQTYWHNHKFSHSSQIRRKSNKKM